MGRTDPKDQDARVFRVRTLDTETIAEGDRVHEVTAAYYQHEHGFVTFKDNDGQAVYAVREELVHQIERLRTHVILAIASEELELILTALHGVRRDDPRDSISFDEMKRTAALAESLERLRPIASQRHTEDPSSLPRTAPTCTCQNTVAEGRWTTVMNPSCPVHRTTASASAAA